MSNAVTVVVPEEHVARVRRIAQAAVWIEVSIVPAVTDAVEGRPLVVIGDPERALVPNAAYVVRAGIPDDQLQALLTAIATGSALAPPTPANIPQTPQEAQLAQYAFAASRKLASASDLSSTEATAVSAVIEMLDADRAHCLYFDTDTGALWSQARQLASDDERHAVAGMAGWTARTGLPCGARVAGDDHRYASAIDDPDGDAGDQILVQPILGADAKVHAVLVAIRRSRRPPFGAAEAAMLARFAALAAPLLDQLSTHVQGQELLEQGRTLRFREEATEAADVRTRGDVVRVTPRWLPWAYWLLVVLLAGSVVLVSLGTISTYSTGPAVVRSMARTSITTRTAGNVSRVEVGPGDRVAAGDVIAHLDDVDQKAAVDRIRREFETQLRNHMLDPADMTSDASLRSLRQGLEQARTALDERAIRATSSGIVSELRVRPGQHVEPGDIAASIVDGSAGLELVALLPGEDRPQLTPGMSIRLELAGYRYAYQSVKIDGISSDVISPTEARRVLGAEVADSLRINGPVVLVRARIPDQAFEVDGKTYQYHDGMLGVAEVPIREERIVFALVPGLRRIAE